MNSYELSRKWFDWSFDNASKVRPVHSALLFFIIEHNNRLGWKKEFGLPRQMAMDAIGVKNNRTFTLAFCDLENWGFIEVIERSKNQYSANIISIIGYVKNTPATTKALTRAVFKHSLKHLPEQVPEHLPEQVPEHLPEQVLGIAPINKPINLKTLKLHKQGKVCAFDVLNEFKTQELQTFEMQNKNSIKDWPDMLKIFNDTIDLEIAQNKIEMEPNQIMPRFRKFVNSWISNRKNNKSKFNQTPEPNSYESGKQPRRR